jgi:hypothetical protein
VGSAPEPADLPGQIVKVLLIMLGVGTLFYALVTVTEFFVAGHLGRDSRGASHPEEASKTSTLIT